MLTVDVDDIIIDYPDTFALMMDLQAMGESNASLTRELSGLRREVLAANEAIYRELHGNKDEEDGIVAGGGEGGGGREEGRKSEKTDTIPATFRIIYMIGWTPGEGQAEPLARGSGQLNLKDVLGGGDFTGGGGGGKSGGSTH